MAQQVYSRNGVPCLLDRSRGYLVQATPEEYVRQDTLNWIINELRIPAKLVRSEFSTSKRGGIGRADILVWAPGSTDDDGEAVLIVECKRPDVFLDDRTREQATAYAMTVSASYVLLTNGDERVVFGKDKGRWRELERVPVWREMLKQRGLRWAAEPAWTRPTWTEIEKPAKCRSLARQGAPYEWIVGEDTPDYIWPFALNLFGCLAFGRDLTLPVEDQAIAIEKDLGLNRRTFGNAAGGTWFSELYRSFLVRENQTNSHQVVSLAVLGGAKFVNDPVFGNARGQTYLIVAVDDGTSSHNSLQLPLDKFVSEGQVLKGRVTIRHDGTMTAGKGGRVARDKVLSFVRREAPQLIDEKTVLLGTLPTNRLITWSDARDLLLRVVRYALVRDRLRSEIRAKAPPRLAPACPWKHGDIVKARYEGKVYEPARFIRLHGKTWAWVHWDTDQFSQVRLKDIVGPSSQPWKLELVAPEFDFSDLSYPDD